MAGVYLSNNVMLNHRLYRVPANPPATRFKCVSIKGGDSFLTSDILLKETHKDHHNLFFISEKTSPSSFYTIDCEAPHKKVPCSRSIPPFEAGARQVIDIASGHGLICLWLHPDLILWNPLTTEYKKLSRMDNTDWYNLSHGGLYYSSCEDDYKLVLKAYTGNVYIYSLRTDSWRMLDSVKLDGYWKLSVSLNDSLYFLSDNERKPYTIVRFDTTAERLQNIATPSVNYSNKKLDSDSATITVHRGYVHYFVKYDIGRPGFLKSTCFELWKLNNAGGDIWKKVATYEVMPNDISSLTPLHLMKNGNWLMVGYKDGYHLTEVALKKKKRYIKDQDAHCHRSKGKNKNKSKCYDECKLYSSGESVVGFPRDIRYTETFVSPNQYMKEVDLHTSDIDFDTLN